MLFEAPLEPGLMLGQRRVLMWDVKPRELQLTRGAFPPQIERTIPGDDIVEIRLDEAGEKSTVSAVLKSGEVVDLIGARPLALARAAAEVIDKVTKMPVSRP